MSGGGGSSSDGGNDMQVSGIEAATSKEKGIIEVEDAPFVINKVEFISSGENQSCWVTTNIEERYLLGLKYNLNVKFDSINFVLDVIPTKASEALSMECTPY